MQKATNALKAALGALTVGKFELLAKASGSTSAGVDFLGHHLSASGSTLSVTPKVANVHRLRVEIHKRLSELSTASSTEQTLDRMMALSAYALAWLHTFAEADNISSIRSEVMLIIQEACQAWHVDFGSVLELAEKVTVGDVQLYNT